MSGTRVAKDRETPADVSLWNRNAGISVPQYGQERCECVELELTQERARTKSTDIRNSETETFSENFFCFDGGRNVALGIDFFRCRAVGRSIGIFRNRRSGGGRGKNPIFSVCGSFSCGDVGPFAPADVASLHLCAAICR